MELNLVEPYLKALLSACIAASKDKGASESVWTEVVTALTAVPTSDAGAHCARLRAAIPKSHAAYKTLTNSVSTAFRAIRFGVALHRKNGTVIGRSEIEKQCKVADAKGKD